MSRSLISELRTLPSLDWSQLSPPSVEVSLIIPARNSSHTLESTVLEAHRFLSERYGNSFEILLVPNSEPEQEEDRSLQVAQELSQKFPHVRVCPHDSPRGKGAAVRRGFFSSRGKWIFLTDADLPYDLRFFDQAAEKLRQGQSLITGNRRLLDSYFQVPVRLLRLAYGRHRLGLAFNQVARWLLPIQTRDTQAGIKAMTREAALEAFSHQSCPGFLFDLEIFLSCQAKGLRHVELPITLHLNTEKTTVKIIRECILVAVWLSRITWRNLRGDYRKNGITQILKRYADAPWTTRLFLTARWYLTPYSVMASKLPQEGKILDLGCGHGLFTLAAALSSSARTMVGIDHDQARVDLASKAARDLSNIQLFTGNMAKPASSPIHAPFAAITLIDVMHYFDPETQAFILKSAFEMLEKGGKLLVREVDPKPGLISSWNRLYEKLATTIGFTQTSRSQLHFRSRDAWENLMKSQGFKVHSERCSHFLFADILYSCER